ncbi:AcrR family transcriptional regulator [Nakamurella sp. UYEF19]|uniref:TetR/AcrR family transcriptional regulator n=1 Tax=Nakamurella sp. UYEF19 TaxID=1756392 RepID=UPI00339464AE
MQEVIDAPAQPAVREPGLREAKKLATKRALSSAARRLGVEHGLDAVTVEMICADAGVSIRTFFNYFESKEAAIVGDAPAIGTTGSQQAFVDGGPTGNLLADLMTLLDPTLAIETEGREEITRAFQLIQSEPKVLALQLSRGVEHERILAELIAARRGLPGVDSTCTTMAAVAQTALRRGGFEWFLSDGQRPVSAHLDDASAALRTLLTG